MTTAATAPPASRRVLLSLHDVTPLHLDRLEQAERVLADLGVRRIAYLLVPNYHGRAPADTEHFRAWCLRERPYHVEWLLHGFYHRETEQPPRQRLGPAAYLQRRYFTAGGGEFVALPADAARRRIAAGIDVFERVLGFRPTVFVPPAWLHHPSLEGELREEGFKAWENRRHVAVLVPQERIRAPVITWATRTFPLRWGSIAGTPLLSAMWSNRKIVRMAVHPEDFDHGPTVASISRIWGRELARRVQMTYGELAAWGEVRARRAEGG